MQTGVKSVCAFGDSVMKGIVVDREHSSVSGLKYKISDMGFAARCRRTLGIEVENFARFGGMVTHAMKFVERYADRIKSADYVLFEYGGNDCDFDWRAISETPYDEHLPRTTADVFESKMKEMISNLNSHQIKFYCVGDTKNITNNTLKAFYKKI